MMKRGACIAVQITAPLALLLLLLAGLGFAFFRTFYASAPEPHYPLAQDAATAQRQDFEYFRNYLELNRSYAPSARDQAAHLLSQYLSQSGQLSAAQFDLAIARMVALSDNGHSQVNPERLSRRHNRLPCRLHHFADGYYVIRARPACAMLLGARILAVDGHSIAQLADRAFEYFGGPRNHYDQFASAFFLESPELLHAAGLVFAADRVNLHAVLRDGSEADAEIVGEAADANEPHAYGDEYLAPQRLTNEAADWATVLAIDAKLPIFLRDYQNPFHSEYLLDKSVYYVQFRSNEDEPGHPIAEFIARVKRDIANDRPRHIVLDLRFDQGGNFTTTAALMKNLTRLADSVEHVDVLTSAWTFSAGNVSLALAKEYGGSKVTVIGEPVGDRVRLWAEGRNMVLPNSKLSIRYATGLHDYSRSCWGQPGCFWVMYFYPMHVSTLEPDIHVTYTFKDHVGLADPLLERALAAPAATQTPPTVSKRQAVGAT